MIVMLSSSSPTLTLLGFVYFWSCIFSYSREPILPSPRQRSALEAARASIKSHRVSIHLDVHLLESSLAIKHNIHQSRITSPVNTTSYNCSAGCPLDDSPLLTTALHVHLQVIKLLAYRRISDVFLPLRVCFLSQSKHCLCQLGVFLGDDDVFTLNLL